MSVAPPSPSHPFPLPPSGACLAPPNPSVLPRGWDVCARRLLPAHAAGSLPAVCPCGAGSACTATGECCHAECLGGCGRPRDNRACVACRHFHFNGHCLPSCPPRTYEYEGWRCVTAEYCASLRKVSHNPRDASKFVIHQRQCLSECPSGYTRNDSRYGGVSPPLPRHRRGGGAVPGSRPVPVLPPAASSATSARGCAPRSARWAPRPSTRRGRRRSWGAAPSWRATSSSTSAGAVSDGPGPPPATHLRGVGLRKGWGVFSLVGRVNGGVSALRVLTPAGCPQITWPRSSRAAWGSSRPSRAS